MICSRNFLYQLLREQIGFKGLLVTDYDEIANLHCWHHAVGMLFLLSLFLSMKFIAICMWKQHLRRRQCAWC